VRVRNTDIRRVCTGMVQNMELLDKPGVQELLSFHRDICKKINDCLNGFCLRIMENTNICVQ
jgi:hypothetical protein